MRARRAAAALLAVAALGIGAVGCGDDDDSGDAGTPAATTAAPGTTAAPPAGGGDATAGKEVFAANCSGCHTLADAGATGAAGPNLDDLKPDEATVQNQVTNGGSAMPAFGDRLSEQQIADVAAYVSSVAGS